MGEHRGRRNAHITAQGKEVLGEKRQRRHVRSRICGKPERRLNLEAAARDAKNSSLSDKRKSSRIFVTSQLEANTSISSVSEKNIECNDITE